MRRDISVAELIRDGLPLMRPTGVGWCGCGVTAPLFDFDELGLCIACYQESVRLRWPTPSRRVA